MQLACELEGDFCEAFVTSYSIGDECLISDHPGGVIFYERPRVMHKVMYQTGMFD
jgi:hypothetical protein